MKKYFLILILVIIFTIVFSLSSSLAAELKTPAGADAINLSNIAFDGESYLVENYQKFKNQIDNLEHPTVALALSGGGARAIANLGVVKALVENDIPIDLMTGTSMGAIIATLYGSGLSVTQIEEIVTDTPFASLFNFGGGALLNSKKANIFIESVAPQKRLEDFLIPTAQLSFDLASGKKYLATEGKISEVLQASYSIPGYFPIHSREGHYFMDAGVLESTPAKSAALLGADFVIATHTPESRSGYDYGGAFQSASRFLEIIQNRYSGQILDRYSDFIITADVKDYTFMDFNYAARLVEIGYQETLKRMPELKKALAAENISLRASEERETFNLDDELRDLEFDRLIVEESGINPLIYYGRDFSPFNQDLFRTPLDRLQLGIEFYHNRARLSFLGDDSWSDGYTAALRVKKIGDSFDLYLKYKNDNDSATDDEYEAELKYFGRRFNLSGGYGSRAGKEYYLFGNDFRYLGENLQWQSENDIFFTRKEETLNLLSSQLINYDFTKAWSIGAEVVYNSSDFVESPLIYRGQELAEYTDLQASLNFNYNYNLRLPLQLLNFLQLTDIGGYLFADYYHDRDRDQEGLAVGPGFNSRLYLLGLKPIEVELFAAHDFEIQDQRYGLQFSYSF
ncbi:NTE family protein [Halanaerobium saccharolyticum]|uniref:NTE family protein n=1 Tax=Halanaerobium saccharolyticum TaxID=43595 RepID=A0A4R7Z780_9FIRM|nr:patatin-like phospholipase family protein [Halanaerobium saccharolyticum]RAK09777.1 NTE family protein [Halanaerobium saccharolyticum]TDW07339.1 NTE family protein [Halanaerobium saccharolyticum]TDX61218.1 NTE family protein [Halanaerobium saccharolyticum]